MRRLLILLLFIPALAFSQQIKPVNGIPHEVREAGNVTFVEQLHYHGMERIFPIGGVTVIYRGEASYADVQASGVVGSSYCAEFQAVYDKWTTKPHDDTAAIFNTMVKTLVDGGVWAKLDRFGFYAVHTNDDGEALVDWIDTDLTATAVNSPTFTAYEGFTGDASASYINSNYNLNTDTVNYSSDDAHIAVYIRTSLTLASVDVGLELATSSGMGVFVYSNNLYARINKRSTNYADMGADHEGFYVGTRNGDNVIGYKNAVNVLDYDDAPDEISSALYDGNVYILARNDINAGPSAEQYSSRQVSCVSFGGKLTPAEVTIYKNAIETAMDALGTGIISE